MVQETTLEMDKNTIAEVPIKVSFNQLRNSLTAAVSKVVKALLIRIEAGVNFQDPKIRVKCLLKRCSTMTTILMTHSTMVVKVSTKLTQCKVLEQVLVVVHLHHLVDKLPVHPIAALQRLQAGKLKLS
jgi:hypothetical protein